MPLSKQIKPPLLLFCLLFAVFNVHCQDKKELNITRAEKAPKIDGELDDKVWENAEIATDFIQFKPEIGNTLPRNKRTEVKVSYDDQAIYVAVYLYDEPEKIMSQLVNRDNFGQTDFFLVVLNPNNDAQNDTSFFVLVAVGFSNRSKPGFINCLVNLIVDDGGVFYRNASGALSLAYVAAGRLIGYSEDHMNAWDYLAGQLMVKEAGGQIEEQDISSVLIRGGRVVAAAPGVFNDLQKFTDRAMK